MLKISISSVIRVRSYFFLHLELLIKWMQVFRYESTPPVLPYICNVYAVPLLIELEDGMFLSTACDKGPANDFDSHYGCLCLEVLSMCYSCYRSQFFSLDK